MRLRFLLSILLAWFAVEQASFGSAFSIRELGVRAQGMGGAFTAVADDASAIFFNPAGIAFQDGLQLEMDSLVVVGLFRFFPSITPPGTIVPEKGYHGSISPKFIPVGNLYLTKKINDRMTFGLGAFAPFGLAANFTNFNDGDPARGKYPGRFAGTRARLEVFWLQPTIAFKLSPNSSVAVGPAFIHTHLFYEQSILSPYDDGKTFGREVAGQLFPGQNPAEAARSIARLLPEGRFRLAGTANSAGVNLGYLYRHPGTHTNIGLSYRSGTAHHLKGKASFAFTDDSAIAPFLPESQTIEDLFPTQDAAGLFQTPATYNIGIANTALPGTTLAMDVTFQDYHRFRALPINFTQTSGTATPPERKIEFDFRNSVVVMAGIEKRMGEDMAVRAGFVFDHTPVPDKSTGPLFPDSSRFSLTLGASKRKGNTEFSVFYQAMNMVARTTNVTENNNQFTNGLYDNFVHLAGVGLRMYIGN